MSRWLLALLLAAPGWPTAGAHDALDAIDGCLRELDPGLDVGYQRIAARCPDLTPTLVQSQYAAWLPRDWNQTGNLLSADGLTELRALLTREPAATAARGAPSVEHVAAVLAKVTQSEQPRAGWWTRLKQWLREVLAPPPARSLTVHELTRAARLPGESDRERLRELATACERVRFGDQQESSSTLAAAIARGRELLEALQAPARERQEAGPAHA